MGGCFSSPQNGPQAVAQAAQPAAAQAAPPPSDPISQGLGDAQQAIGLIDGIYRIVEPTILEASHKRNEKNSLKKFLGPWWKEAFEYGACMIPVLDIEEFEKHLQMTNGVLEPRGNCTADSPWGYLLHALAINPGDQILTWKPASGARWDMPEGTLAMDVRGKVFCHLVNLYNVESPSEKRDIIEGTSQVSGSCRLSFGWLSWTSTHEGHMVAKFEPDTIRKLNGRKEPLGWMGLQLGNRLWKAYADALELGISDPKLVWPDPNTTPFPRRLKCLITNMPRLSDGRKVVLTKAWLESASRIKIRAMSNGGKDDTFLEDVYKTLAEHPTRRMVAEYRIKELQASLRRCFFFEDDRFSLDELVNSGPPSFPSWGPNISHANVLERTLEAYSIEDPASWKGQLYASRDLVLRVALMRTEYDCPPGVRVLAFGSRDPLWNARVHL
jgi:hypothetical protein